MNIKKYISRFNLLTQRGRLGGGHAFALMRENKLFSAIYIAGTAVAIASAMVVAIVLNIMLVNNYPEMHRDRTLYVNVSQYKESEIGGPIMCGCSTLAVDELFNKMECVELAIGDHSSNQMSVNTDSIPFVQSQVDVHQCDYRFFRFYDFDFIEGRPFSEQEFRDSMNVCVITDKLAKKLGLTTHDQSTIYLGSFPFRIVGIVRGASIMMNASYSEVYIPYKTPHMLRVMDSPNSYEGDLGVRVLLKKGYTRNDFLKEVEPLRSRYEAVQSSAQGERVYFTVEAHSQFFSVFNSFNSDDESISDMGKNLLLPALLMLFFLMLPALNLSSLVSNRMERRRPEMGIRKAFGAKWRTLLSEVINENLILTLCGGFVGWILSWLFIVCVKDTHFVRMFVYRIDNEPLGDVALNFKMFFTPTLFLVVFLCCAILNLLVALIPAWRSLKSPIVESLNQKK